MRIGLEFMESLTIWEYYAVAAAVARQVSLRIPVRLPLRYSVPDALRSAASLFTAPAPASTWNMTTSFF